MGKVRYASFSAYSTNQCTFQAQPSYVVDKKTFFTPYLYPSRKLHPCTTVLFTVAVGK